MKYMVIQISLKFVDRGPINKKSLCEPNRRKAIIWAFASLVY